MVYVTLFDNKEKTYKKKANRKKMNNKKNDDDKPLFGCLLFSRPRDHERRLNMSQASPEPFIFYSVPFDSAN